MLMAASLVGKMFYVDIRVLESEPLKERKKTKKKKKNSSLFWKIISKM